MQLGLPTDVANSRSQCLMCNLSLDWRLVILRRRAEIVKRDLKLNPDRDLDQLAMSQKGPGHEFSH